MPFFSAIFVFITISKKYAVFMLDVVLDSDWSEGVDKFSKSHD